ncbi:MAG: hypothetical protein CMP91_04830 [Gammaproteobacteria bacterium]|nr:hypothetical protein [Gammaproteobacteria bacterium]MAY03057.1 hypothetical protein [Gammaproteobacteria bacterium]|tara:strand:+ start:594 stop:1154 length:561 start_codon:yes stop_codon:yes gene_type:complete
MKHTPLIKSIDYLHEAEPTQQCLLIELDSGAEPRQLVRQLIVPRVLVVEIIDYEGLEINTQNNSELAVFNWRGVDVPLLTGNVFGAESSGQRGPNLETGTGDKIVIFHGLANPQELAFYALRTGRNPRLVNISEKDICQNSSRELQETELMDVVVNDEPAIIPKVDYLEHHIHALHLQSQRQGDRQ